jgi:hypothetical protein
MDWQVHNMSGLHPVDAGLHLSEVGRVVPHGTWRRGSPRSFLQFDHDFVKRNLPVVDRRFDPAPLGVNHVAGAISPWTRSGIVLPSFASPAKPSTISVVSTCHLAISCDGIAPS